MPASETETRRWQVQRLPNDDIVPSWSKHGSRAEAFAAARRLKPCAELYHHVLVLDPNGNAVWNVLTDPEPPSPDTTPDHSRVPRDCPSCGRHTILREDRLCSRCWVEERDTPTPDSESTISESGSQPEDAGDQQADTSRVAEDVERLRSVAKFHTGTDLAPEDEAALTRVLDAYEITRAALLAVAGDQRFSDGFCGEMPWEMREQIEEAVKNG